MRTRIRNFLRPIKHRLLRSIKYRLIISPTRVLKESGLFDPQYYCREYPDAAKYAASPAKAYKHFLSVGLANNRRPSVFFDTDWYLDKTPAIRELGYDAISHYLFFKFGCREKKSPCPLFDAAFYQKKYEVADCEDLFAHYLTHALPEDRQPCAWFDPIFYRRTYLGEWPEPTSPLKHFLEFGLKKHLYPNNDVAELPEKPVISVLMPVYNVEIAHLNTCIRSVLYQSYPHWELCLADDCSTNPEIRLLLTCWAASDPRIKVVCLAKNSGISAATNAAAGLAGGSYLAFLDNDDELATEALQYFVKRINNQPADLYYSDEDLIGTDGRQLSVFRKPDFNSELLLCHNYITHCVLTSKALYEKVGGCAGELNGAQDLDLFLKLSEKATAIIHIPEVLYHWRALPTSTSTNHNQKSYADEAGRQSVAGALARREIRGETLFTDWKFFYRAKRAIMREVSVTLVVNWERSEEEILDWLTKLLAASGHKVWQVVLLMATHPSDALIEALAQATGIVATYRIFPEGQGFAAKLHSALPDIHGELVALVNGDLDITSDHWLAALVEYGQSPEVGMVGGQIEYPAEDALTVTPIADCNITSPLYYARFLTDCSVLLNIGLCPQEVLGVGSDLTLVRRELLLAADGFHARQFPFLFAFIDFSFSLHQQGKKNIYTPYCKATTNARSIIRHRQWSSTALQEEKARFQHKWFDVLHRGNPFYNPGIVSDSGRSVDEFRAWLTGPRQA